MKKRYITLILTFLLCAILMGCGKEDKHLNTVTEAADGGVVSSAPTVSEATDAESFSEELVSSLPYKPGRIGFYIMADPDIEAGSEVLDSISFNATDGDAELTRYQVSNRQHDLIKNGMQVGGFILIDIPKDMLDEAVDSFDGFKALADYVGKQVLPDVYPEKAIIGGGGHLTGGTHNSFVSITYQMGEGQSKAQQWHRIYVGENYCYDFWQDQSWFSDGGAAIMESLTAEDIKPERNRDAAFKWTIEEVQEQGKFVF